MILRIFFIGLLISAGTTSSILAQFIINDIYPKSATPGSSITVHGYGYPHTTYAILKFLPVDGGTGIEATVTSSSLNAITATVPSGLSEGNYRLEVTRDFTDDTLQAISPTVFTVLDEGGYFGENGSNVEDLLSGGQYSNFQSIDFNSNGHSDFVYTSFSSGKVYWAENDGNSSPSFTEHEVATLARAQYVKAADIDLDGDMDIVVTQNNTLYYPTVSFKLFWYENDGASSPSFTQHEIADFSGSNLNWIDDLVLLDFDNDGYQDVIVSTHDDKEIAFFRNNSGSSSHFNSKQVVKSFPTNFARRLRVGDMNSDGLLDIVYATLTEVGWIKYNGGSFTNAVINDNEVYNSFTLHLSDIDNDGDVDILTDRNTDKIYLLENDGASLPNFTLSTIADNVDAKRTVSGDMDADGDTDLLLKNGNENLTWLINDGNSPAIFSKFSITDSEYDLRDIQLGNINNDGGLDIIFRTPSSLNYFKNIDRPDALGYSLMFDGDGDHISIADDDALDLTNIFTIEGWVKPANLDAGFQRLVSKAGAYGLGISESKIRFTAYGVKDYDLAHSFEDDTWVHIAAKINVINRVLFYVNGTYVGMVNSSSGDPSTSSDPLLIGNNSTESESFNGIIDEIRIWNDLRSEQEIQTNMYQSLVGDEPDLLAYYSFDGDGTTAVDFTANTFDGTLAGDVARDNDTHPYGAIITGNEGWRMMSAPVGGASYGELLDTLWTQGFTGADVSHGSPNVLSWDESTQSFNAIANASDVPDVGQGFIVYVFDDQDYDGSVEGFPKVIQTDNSQNVGDITKTLSFTDSGTLADDGWNLVGNPYGATIDWDAASGLTSSNLDDTFYVWSDSANGGAGDYLTWNGSTGTLSNGLIAPWQGFWVKANAADPSLAITDEVRSSEGVFRKDAPTPELRLTISDGQFENSVIVMFSDKAKAGKDNLDAYKLQSLNADYLSLFTQTEGGAALDINALPGELEEPVSIPMSIARGGSIATLTEFELSWNLETMPESWNFTLIDNQTGQEIDLSQQSSIEIKLGNVQSSKTLEGSGEDNLSAPNHSIMVPKVLKTTNNGSVTRFTLTIKSKQTVANERLADIPSEVELEQNYPNPFNPTTTIEYGVPETGQVTMDIFNMLGQKVATLINRENKAAGRHSIQFDAGNLASGLYLYRLKAGNTVITKKLTLIK